MAKLIGFMVALSGFAGACTFVSAGSEASKPDTQGGQGNRTVNVTRLYDETCAKCHGSNAEGGGGGTPSLISLAKFSQKNDRVFFEAIKNGVPNMGMEAYGGSLSDEEIWGLVVHIRELQAKGLRAEKGSTKFDANGVAQGQRHSYRIETVVDSGLKTPWGVSWLPDGRMLVTNRPGTMHLVAKNGQLSPAIEGLPTVLELGQGGLMDVAVHPQYTRNGWVYLAYTEAAADNPRAGQTKIVRGKLRTEGGTTKWVDQQTIYQAAKEFYTGAGVHFGSRIVFDGKGHVFFVIGERGGNMIAQDIKNPAGKIFRVNEDGSIPKDNPFVNQAGAEAVWSYGHRNPQGLVQALDGSLWATEHAPRGGDELNQIEKGTNYGWPVVSYGINYNDTPFRTPWPKDGQAIKLPAFRWLPSIGASGLVVANGSAFPQWKGDLLAGGLSGNNVDRIRIANGEVVEHEELLHGMGRVRDVKTAPDGSVVVVLNGPDKIIRLVPAK